MPGPIGSMYHFQKLREDIKKLKEITHRVEHRITLTMVASISAALAFVIALSWNDTIRAATDNLMVSLGMVGTSLRYSLIKSVIVTAICIVGIYLVSKLEIFSK
jgi:uncharacterized membrane protein YjjP (DUF1212 family)